MKRSVLSYFTGSFAFCAIGLVAAWFLGGARAVMTVAFLTLLETSLSFDNAVVNAGILKHWDEKWRRRFLVWGILIAVFGMRIVFPLLVVAVAGHIGPLHAVDLALHQPDEYSRILTSAHHEIAAFGGAFLMMVFLKFFVARNKTEHWLRQIERPLTRLGKLEAIEAALTLTLVLLAARFIDPELQGDYVIAGAWGIIAFIVAKGLAALVSGDEEAAHHVVKQGMAGFLYLELLDASFSFDGVVGAFAMTHDLFIIAIGLGAGAMFVRAFTLLLVDRQTLGKFRYLEHGAFWAIGALAVIMLVGVEYHIPEFVTGLIGAALIVLSMVSSMMANRRERSAS